jgi:predicted DNA-binding ribbon-helix-helix protein
MGRDTVPVVIRLMPDVATGLREHVRRRGDVAALILGAVAEIDLLKVSIPTICFKEHGVETTVCNMPEQQYDALKKVAASRNCSVNALLNGAIDKHSRNLKRKAERNRTVERRRV